MTKINFKGNKTQPIIAAAIVIGLLAISPTIYSAYAAVFQTQFGSFGSGNGQFSSPVGDTIDSAGNIYVADMNNNRVEKLTNAGVFISQIGCPSGACPSGTLNGQLNFPRGVAIDSSGNVWITDTGNQRVEKFDFSGNWLATYTTANGVGFGNPNGIWIDVHNNVWIADAGNNRIVELDSLGTFVKQFNTANGATFFAPQYVAIDSAGNIWISDSGNQRVIVLNSAGTFVKQLGLCTMGACGVSGNNGAFNNPSGIAFDTNGNAWISDKNNNRVEEFNSLGYVSQVGCGTGSCPGGTGNGALDFPTGVAVDTFNKIYVVDSGNNIVQVFQ